jgi:hypothetical protein
MPVLGKRRMIWDLAVQAEAAEPAIGEIEMHLLAQVTFRANVKTIADERNTDVNSGSTDGRPVLL